MFLNYSHMMLMKQALDLNTFLTVKHQLSVFVFIFYCDTHRNARLSNKRSEICAN